MNATHHSSLDFLVIDDEPSLSELYSRFLEIAAREFNVKVSIDTAADGAEGLSKYNTKRNSGKPYDVVLTDLKMPKVTGDKVTESVKRLDPQTLVYVITGREATEEYAKLSARLGQLKPEEVIQKPIDISGFKRLFKEVIDKKINPKTLNKAQTPEIYQS